MTYNNTTGVTEFGARPYIGHYNKTTYVDDLTCIQLPSNVSLLNREGELCGKCKDGYGIALYSYTL